MQTEETVQALQKKLSALNLQERESQTAMMSASLEAFHHSKLLCVEAPTGVGKTLAYCLAALEAKSNDQVIIISTATIALQEQLLEKDIPLLEKILNRKIKATVAKGRRRYICHSRLYHPERYSDDSASAEFVFDLQNLLEDKQWSGEKETLEDFMPEQDWQKISTDSSGCSGSHCEFFEDCVFFKTRKRVAISDIVIVNHSLLLSDLELGGGVILPEMEKCLYIIDECHHLPEKAVSYFALQAAVMRSTDWLNTLPRVLKSAAMQMKLSNTLSDSIIEANKLLVKALESAKHYFANREREFDQDQLRVTNLDDELIEVAKAIVYHADKISQNSEVLLQALEEAHERHERSDKERAKAIMSLIESLRFVLSRSENLAQTWQSFSKMEDDYGVPVAKWVEKKEFRHHDEGFVKDFTCFVSPINASGRLKELLWDKVENGALLCSATVRSLGEFSDYIRKTGLKNDERVKTLALDSAFDYEDSILFVPSMQCEPTGPSQQKHLEEVMTLIPQLVLPSGGTLVLFTSKYAMEQTFQSLPVELRMLTLMQGQKGKAQMIASHKKRIDAGRSSILFGLASLAEGIDLPGKYCQHVIIHKLPFAVPSSPIEMTRSEWLQKNQLNPFMLSTLPQASIRLTQYVGRLLRCETDVGMVSVLDRRLYSKHYGKSLLGNLPKFQMMVNQSLDDLKNSDLGKRFYAGASVGV